MTGIAHAVLGVVLLAILAGCQTTHPVYCTAQPTVPAAEVAAQPVYGAYSAEPVAVVQPIEVAPAPVYYESSTYGGPFWDTYPVAYPVHHPAGARHHHHHEHHRHGHGNLVPPPAMHRAPASRPSASRRPAARPPVTRPTGGRPAVSRPAGSRPSNPRPHSARPSGPRPSGGRPSGARPSGGGKKRR